MLEYSPPEKDNPLSTAPKQGYGSDADENEDDNVISTANFNQSSESKITFEDNTQLPLLSPPPAVLAPLNAPTPYQTPSSNNPFSGAYAPFEPKTDIVQPQPNTIYPSYPSAPITNYPANHYPVAKSYTMGIVALILMFFFPPAGLVLGIMSTKKAATGTTSFGLSITSVILNSMILGVWFFFIMLLTLSSFVPYGY